MVHIEEQNGHFMRMFFGQCSHFRLVWTKGAVLHDPKYSCFDGFRQGSWGG